MITWREKIWKLFCFAYSSIHVHVLFTLFMLCCGTTSICQLSKFCSWKYCPPFLHQLCNESVDLSVESYVTLYRSGHFHMEVFWGQVVAREGHFLEIVNRMNWYHRVSVKCVILLTLSVYWQRGSTIFQINGLGYYACTRTLFSVPLLD